MNVVDISIGNLNPSASEDPAKYYEGYVTASVFDEDCVKGYHTNADERGNRMQQPKYRNIWKRLDKHFPVG